MSTKKYMKFKSRKFEEKDKQIAVVMKLTRLNQKITQGDMAAKVGVSQALIAKFESMKQKMGQDTLLKVFNILGFKVSNYQDLVDKVGSFKIVTHHEIPVSEKIIETPEEYEDLLITKKSTIKLTPAPQGTVFDENRYALYISNNSMEPLFPKNTYIIIDFPKENVDALELSSMRDWILVFKVIPNTKLKGIHYDEKLLNKTFIKRVYLASHTTFPYQKYDNDKVFLENRNDYVFVVKEDDNYMTFLRSDEIKVIGFVSAMVDYNPKITKLI